MPLAQLPPGARGYLAAEQQAQETGQRNLAGLTQATQLRGALQKMQQEQELRGILSQTGGDPAKAIQVLMQNGTPQSLALAAQLKGLLPKPAEPYTLAPGAERRDANNKVVATAPKLPPTQQPSNVSRLIAERDAIPEGDPRRRIYDQAITHATNPQAQRIIIPPQPLPVQTHTDGSGRLWERERGGKWTLATTGDGAPGITPKPGATKQPTDSQLLSSGYADRMIASERIMSAPAVEAEAKPGVIESSVGVLPGVGKLASNLARPAERQQYRQAQEDWVRAKLRKESGAVIGDEEMDREIRVYFPQMGDSPKVVAQKKASRAVATQAMLNAADKTPHAGAAPVSPANVVDFGSLK